MQLNKRILGAGSILAAAGRIALNYESTAYKNNRDIRTSTTAKGEIEPLMAKIAAVAPDHVDMIKSQLVERNDTAYRRAKEELKVLRDINTAERLAVFRAIRDIQKKKFSAKINAKDIEHMLSRYGTDARDISVDHGVIKWTTSIKKLGVTHEMTISINTHTDTLHVTSGGLHSSRNTPPLRYTTRSGLMDNLAVLVSWAMQQIDGRSTAHIATADNQQVNIAPAYIDAATIDAALGANNVTRRARAPVPPAEMGRDAPPGWVIPDGTFHLGNWTVPQAITPDTNQPDEMFVEE